MRGSSGITAVIFSFTAFTLPGSVSTSVLPIVPATGRDTCISPGASRCSSGLIASGVTSLRLKPVPVWLCSAKRDNKCEFTQYENVPKRRTTCLISCRMHDVHPPSTNHFTDAPSKVLRRKP
eukprot:14808-Heterococcus_DN1.PRE.2